MKIVRYFAVVVFALSFIMLGTVAKADVVDSELCGGLSCVHPRNFSMTYCEYNKSADEADPTKSELLGPRHLLANCDKTVSIFSSSWFYIGLFITLIVECTLIAILNGWKRNLVLKVALINVITYTILNVLLVLKGRYILDTAPYIWLVIIGELAVMLVEALYFKLVFKWTKKRSILMSLLANSASVFVGFLVGLVLH